MRAVNLIPVDARRGPGAAGQSGGMVYVLLGVLGALLVAAVAYAIVAKSVNDRRAELAEVRAQADAAETRARDLQAYVRFAELRAKRVKTVTDLVAGRFDWAHTLREVSRVLPDNASLTGLKGTTGATGAAATGGTPSIQIDGCTTSQKSVARTMARMRLIDGVQNVQLTTSDKGTGGGSCRENSPVFSMVLSFRAPTGTTTSTATPSQGAAR
jgi:Tfp pilus assembly protein PilN